tara:strand:- start:36 stop:542 length:507 start_codon:yes stop_codon:yes gene_type:complete
MSKGKYDDFSCNLDEKGWDNVLKDMNFLDEREVEYGYPERSVIHKESKESIVDIAHWNNDGVKSSKGGWHIPPREFMDMAAMFTEEDMDKYNKLIETTLSKFKGRDKLETVLRVIGGMTADNIREAIDTGEFAPLAPSTVEQKGSDTILVETGQLYDDATYKINKVGE